MRDLLLVAVTGLVAAGCGSEESDGLRPCFSGLRRRNLSRAARGGCRRHFLQCRKEPQRLWQNERQRRVQTDDVFRERRGGRRTTRRDGDEN